MILEQNAFIDQALPNSVATSLGEEDLAEYRRPYPTPESRRPILQWARAMPLDGRPADVVTRVERYDEWLATSADVPKLLLAFEPGPGAMTGPDSVDWCAANIANLEISRHGIAGHHVQEDHPEAIAAAIAAWVDEHGLR